MSVKGLDRDVGNREFGIVLGLYKGGDTYDTELQRTSAGGSTFVTIQEFPWTVSQAFQYTDYLPNDNLAYGYRARHVGAGVSAGAWTPTVSGSPEELSDGPEPTPPVNTDGIDINLSLRTLSGPALTLSGGVLSHSESGVASDGDAVSFNSTFINLPKVWFTPQGGKTYSTAFGAAAQQAIDIRAQDLTATGFSMRAKLVSGQTGTTQQDTWSTALNSAESADETISTEDAELFSSLSAATTVQTDYQAKYSWDGTSMDGGVLGLVQLWRNTSAASTDWTLADSRYHDSSTSNDNVLAFNGAMGSSWDVRLTLNYSKSPTGGGVVTAHDVTYIAMSTAVAEESMTTGVGDGILWHAVEAP